MTVSQKHNNTNEQTMSSHRMLRALACVLAVSSDGVHGFSSAVSGGSNTAVNHRVAAVLSRSATATKASRKRRSSLKPLQYQNVDMATVEDSNTASTSSWWNSMFANGQQQQQQQTGDQQEVVDDYLEFLERRYQRHYRSNDNDDVIKFSALSWLNNNNNNDKKSSVDAPPTATSKAEEKQEKALYVLGVAELASEKLLQKHNLHLRQDMAPQTTTMVATKESSPLFSTPSEAGAKAVVSLLKKIEAQRQLLIRYQIQKVRALLTLAVRSVINSPTFLLNISGGKKTITYTVSSIVTAVVLLRPIIEAIVCEGGMNV